MKRKLRAGGLRAPAAGQGTAARPPRSMFDKGERHAEPLPAKFVVWAEDPGWVGEFADYALDVRLPSLGLEPGNSGGGGDDPSHLPRDTLVVTASVPPDSPSYAVNLCPAEHGGGEEIWLHFNPRQFERGGSLVVDFKKDGEWVRGERRHLAPLPQLFGLERLQLAFHVSKDGVRVAANGFLFLQFGFRPESQAPPAHNDEAAVHLPTCDDKGAPFRWTVHNVW